MRGAPSFLLQLKKNHEILTSMQDEALCCSVSREIPTSLLSLERVLENLDATQEVPRHTRLHSRETPSVQPQLTKAPFLPPHLETRVHIPASLGKESQHSLCTSRGGGFNLKLLRNSRGFDIIQTPMSQSTPGTPNSPELTRLSLQISTPNTMAGVTALWHLERKSQFPM